MPNLRAAQRLWAKAGVAGASIIAGLLMAEAFSRLFITAPYYAEAGNPPGIRPGYVLGVEENASRSANTLYLSTAHGVRMRPNVSVTIHNNRLSDRPVQLTTNELGLRAPSLTALSGAKQIVLLLGDSITAGEYLEEELTLAGQLQRNLGNAFTVVNAGVNGLGIEDETSLLREVGERIRPSIVVLNFYLNDAVRSPAIRILTPPSVLSWSHVARHLANGLSLLLARTDSQTVAPAMAARWAEELERLPANRRASPHSREFFYSQVQDAFGDWGNAWSTSVWEHFEEKMAELRSVAERQGARLLIAGFPVRSQVESPFLEDFPQRQLAEKAAALGLRFIDLLAPLRAHFSQGQSQLFYDHCHPNEEGFALIGKYLAEQLRASYPEQPREL